MYIINNIKTIKIKKSLLKYTRNRAKNKKQNRIFGGISIFLERDKIGGFTTIFDRRSGGGVANFFLHLLKRKHYFVDFFKRRPSMTILAYLH